MSRDISSVSEESIKKHSKLVNKVALKYKNIKNRKIEYEDLIQEGLIGLCSALENYDEDRSKFSTYAWYFIDGSMKNFIRRNFEITTPNHIINDIMKFSYKLNKIKKQYGEDLSIDQISKLTGYSIDNVEVYIRTLSSVYSLEEIDVEELETILYDRNDEKYELNNYFEDVMIDKIYNKKLSFINDIFNNVKLTEPQKLVIYYRYGFDGSTGKTLEEIGRMLGSTRQSAGLVEKAALKKIKEYLLTLGYDKGRQKLRSLNRICN